MGIYSLLESPTGFEMNRIPSSRSVTARTFLHPLIKQLATPWVTHTAPLGVRVEHAQVAFFTETEIRGDTCEKPFDLPAVWATHPPIMCWSVSITRSREYGRNLCTVFSPDGFDIEKYGTDLALLYSVQVMSELARCAGMDGEWGEIARYLAGTAVSTQASGWVHSDSGVVVVCTKMEGASLLISELLTRCGRTPHNVDEYILQSNPTVTWKKATNMVSRYIAQHVHASGGTM